MILAEVLPLDRERPIQQRDALGCTALRGTRLPEVVRPLFAAASIVSGGQSIPTSDVRFWPFSLCRTRPRRLSAMTQRSWPNLRREGESFGAQAKAFERLSSAKVVRLPFSNPYVFFSNEADVLREMNAFIGSLPPVQ
jgi:hypothetical protein